jgi:hypothetical protein
VDITTLRDPETDVSRALDPAWYVFIIYSGRMSEQMLLTS